MISDSDSDRTVDSDELRESIASSKSETNSRNSPADFKGKSTQKIRSVNLHEMSDSESEGEYNDSDKKNLRKKLLQVNKTITSEVDKKHDARISKVSNDLPRCKYGDKCYRKNPDHLKMFHHSKIDGSDKNEELPVAKKRKTEEHASGAQTSHPRKANVFNFFMTRVFGISNKYNDYIALGIRDILSPSRGRLKSSAQFNFMFDVQWLMEQYPPEFRKLPLLIIHGEERASKSALEKTGLAFPNIKFSKAQLPIPFGTHHTKMMLLLYNEGLRVVILTANLVENDWMQKTQGIWVSPLFPALNSGPSVTEGESPTKFKADLLEYLSSYGIAELEEWCNVIKGHDLSTARVFIVGSIPGRHIGMRKTSFGHLKLRKLLNSHGPSKEVVSNDWPVIGQFSSIGSLGSAPEQWLCSEWLSSLATIRGCNLSVTPPLKLVYPSVENVRMSLEGYPAGASLPYSYKVAEKQPYLRNFLHQWKSNHVGRDEASPHIKTYMRVAPDSKKISWFLVTSANLSKAAWGSLEKNGTQLMIRSYELGVLFLPQNFENEQYFATPNIKDNVAGLCFPVPFDLPLLKYSATDQPWIWDIPHVHAPDCNGNKWCPPI